jgi:hypothetical protein
MTSSMVKIIMPEQAEIIQRCSLVGSLAYACVSGDRHRRNQ